MSTDVYGQQVADPRSGSVLTKKSKRSISLKRRRNRFFSRAQKPGRTLGKSEQIRQEKATNIRHTFAQIPGRTLGKANQIKKHRNSNRRHSDKQFPGRTLGKADQLEMERLANRRHTKSERPGPTLNKPEQIRQERAANIRHANAEFPYRTLSKSRQLKKERNSSRRHSDTQFPYRTLAKGQQLEMERRSNKRHTASQFPYRTLGKANQLKMERATNKRLSNYEVAYLNTKAERRARLRSFFYPNEYPANSPEEKAIDARNASRKMADYKGELVVRRRGKDMHPSAQWLGSQSASSLEAKSRYRKRALRQNRSNTKANLPVYMRNEPPKAKYDKDIPKDFWND